MSYFFPGLWHFGAALLWALGLGVLTHEQAAWWLWRLEFLIPLIVSSSALFWIPESYAKRGLMKFLHYPLPDWDVLFLSPASHRHWLFHSAILPIGCGLLLWHYPVLLDVKLPFRWIGVGLSTGLGSHLFWDCVGSRRHKIVIFPHVWHLHEAASRAWLLVGAAASLVIALQLALPK
jgi:hypothetical protein